MFGGRAKHALGRLAVRTPEGAIKDGAAVLQTLRKRVEFIGPRRNHKGRQRAENNKADNDPPENQDAVLHPVRSHTAKKNFNLFFKYR